MPFISLFRFFSTSFKVNDYILFTGYINIEFNIGEIVSCKAHWSNEINIIYTQTSLIVYNYITERVHNVKPRY